jgi:hypothetical protein
MAPVTVPNERIAGGKAEVDHHVERHVVGVCAHVLGRAFGRLWRPGAEGPTNPVTISVDLPAKVGAVAIVMGAGLARGSIAQNGHTLQRVPGFAARHVGYALLAFGAVSSEGVTIAATHERHVVDAVRSRGPGLVFGGGPARAGQPEGENGNREDCTLHRDARLDSR